ncbi:MAG: motility protein A [Lachnospiraceae bacterium]|nr:motility protein A [Lachnospiraceae bacterium]
MDIGSVIGLIICLGLMLFGMGISSIPNFIDIPSVLITFGGAFMATLAMNTVQSFLAGMGTFKIIFRMSTVKPTEIIGQIIQLSNTARKEGLLSLEEAASNIEDPFMKKGIMLVVDGTDPELVRAIMETEMDAIEGRHKEAKGFWENLGGMGPAWGMIGTLIGLVKMLQDLSDPNSIGPSMAVALLTTFYGSLLSNWICTPVATKLDRRNQEEMAVKGIQVEGLLSIQAGENPRVIEEKLKSYLSPAEAAGISSEGGEGGAS